MRKEQKNITQEVYNKLREGIITGEFKGGERLTERLLTDKYTVSRALMREVIRQLSSEGYLTVEPNRGAVVTKLSLEEVGIIFNVLLRCESYATLLFVKSKNNVIIKKLEVLFKKMQTKNTKLKYKTWLQVNDKFHELIYKNCGSSTLGDLIVNIRLRIHRFRMAKTVIEIINKYNKQHKQILKAIQEGNGKLAERLMANHMETAKKHRFETLREIKELL